MLMLIDFDLHEIEFDHSLRLIVRSKHQQPITLDLGILVIQNMFGILSAYRSNKSEIFSQITAVDSMKVNVLVLHWVRIVQLFTRCVARRDFWKPINDSLL